MARGGRFEDGFYVWEDEEGNTHNQDAFEAKWEAIYDKKIAYPEARYHSIVLMNPASYAWIKDPENPGVARKLLGAFSEREIRIACVELDKGASLSFGNEPAAEIAFLEEGALTHNGTTHGAHSGFATTADEHPQTLVAAEDSRLLYLKLPTFDGWSEVTTLSSDEVRLTEWTECGGCAGEMGRDATARTRRSDRGEERPLIFSSVSPHSMTPR